MINWQTRRLHETITRLKAEAVEKDKRLNSKEVELVESEITIERLMYERENALRKYHNVLGTQSQYALIAEGSDHEALMKELRQINKRLMLRLGYDAVSVRGVQHASSNKKGEALREAWSDAPDPGAIVPREDGKEGADQGTGA